MYIVVNRTRSVVNLKDLEWTLGPRKSVDLDSVRSRKQIDESSDLKKAVKEGKIQIRHSSVSQTSKESQYLGPLKPTIKSKIPTLNDKYIERIRLAIREEVEGQFAKKSGEKPPPKSDDEMKLLLLQMKQMIESQQNQPQHVIYDKPQEPDEDLDLDQLSEIHAKSIGKLTKDVKGEVRYSEQKSDADIDKDLDDLEDILG